MYKAVSIFCLLSVPFSAAAQETRVETQSIRCGALTHVQASLGKESPAFGTAMVTTTMFYNSLFSAGRFTRTGLETTDRLILARRDIVLAELKKSWKSNPESVVQEVALCNTWRAAYAPRIVRLVESSSPEDLVRAVGYPPEQGSTEQVVKWRPLVNQAFGVWDAIGATTGKRSHKESGQ
jgi:hypothetical protein